MAGSIVAKEWPRPCHLAAAKQSKMFSSDESDGDGLESEEIIFVKTEPVPCGRAAKTSKANELCPVTGKVSPLVSKFVIFPFS